MARRVISTGALLCALSVAAGAFGAHGLEARLSERSLDLWETAARYLMVGGFGALLAGLTGLAGLATRRLSRALGASGWCLVAGSTIFSGTVFLLALGGPRWVGAITPIGGTLLIAGFLLLAWGAFRL